MNRSILLAFLFGVGTGGAGTATLVDSTGVAFPEPASAVTKLDARAQARFVPFTAEHFQYVHISFRGVPAQTDAGVLWAPATHARIRVPSTRSGGAPFQHEHRSLTRSETVDLIVGLTQGVVFPAALEQCPDLADDESYPPLSEAHVDYVGVEGSLAVARLVVPSLLPGLPEVQCVARISAPDEALAQVTAAKDEFLIPAIKAETGLR
jgi:hypothetical protein